MQAHGFSVHFVLPFPKEAVEVRILFELVLVDEGVTSVLVQDRECSYLVFSLEAGVLVCRLVALRDVVKLVVACWKAVAAEPTL